MIFPKQCQTQVTFSLINRGPIFERPQKVGTGNGEKGGGKLKRRESSGNYQALRLGGCQISPPRKFHNFGRLKWIFKKQCQTQVTFLLINRGPIFERPQKLGTGNGKKGDEKLKKCDSSGNYQALRLGGCQRWPSQKLHNFRRLKWIFKKRCQTQVTFSLINRGPIFERPQKLGTGNGEKGGGKLKRRDPSGNYQALRLAGCQISPPRKSRNFGRLKWIFKKRCQTQVTFSLINRGPIFERPQKFGTGNGKKGDEKLKKCDSSGNYQALRLGGCQISPPQKSRNFGRLKWIFPKRCQTQVTFSLINRGPIFCKAPKI